MTALHDLERRLEQCRGVLIDSNILIGIGTNDPVWAEWSRQAVAECVEQTTLFLNPIVYAEISGFLTIEELEEKLPGEIYQKSHFPWAAGFLAGRAFLAYKRRGGTRTSPLPDFILEPMRL